MRSKTIYIEGKPFTYNDESDDINYTSIEALSYDDAKELLSQTQELFNKCNLTLILAYGTLLGAVREHSLIAGDEDLDVITLDGEKLIRALPFLQKNGLHPCRISSKVISFKNGKNCYIDVYIKRNFKHNIWALYCYDLIGHAIRKKYLDNLEEIEFLGGRYLKPKDHDGVLTSWYDANWRTPVRGHNLWIEGETSHYYWTKKIRPFLFELVGYPYWRHILKGNGKTLKQSLEEWREFRK